MDELLSRLKRTFVGELDERVHALNRDLLALESNPTDAERTFLLNGLFRSAHSLKGAANSVEIGLIESACHYLEDFFMAGLEQRLVLDSDTTDLLFNVVDAIQDAGSRLRQDQAIEQGPLGGLLPRLADAASSVSGGGRPGPAASPADCSPASGQGEVPDPAPSDVRSSPLSPAATEREADGTSNLPMGPSDRDSLLVRVAAEKLDTLLARSSELMVASRRTAARAADLAELHQRVRRWRAARPRTRVETHLAAAPGQAVESQQEVGRPVALAADPTAVFLRRLERDLERCGATLAADRAMLGQAVGAIDGEIRRARMQPLSEVCLGLGRAVRDLARTTGKNVRLVVTGGEVELDRSVLDGLKDPLLHLVRNAVDHGIERSEQRRAAGKPAQGEIRLGAALHGNSVEIVVADDGAGLDLAAIRLQAHRRGLPDGDDAQIANCIFLPGFSTASAVTSLSGRGMGLDEVRSRVERMRGSVGVSSLPGEATRFLLRVPLTLTTLHALLVRAGGEIFALDSTSVIELRRITRDALRSVGGRDMLPVHGRLIPVVKLASLLGLDAMISRDAGAKLPVVLLGAASSDVALMVDELLDEQELMVRGLGSRLRYVRHIAGATMLANGRVALILNSAELVSTALDLGLKNSPVSQSTDSAAPVPRRLLLVEDSVTTRTLERSILESAGYEVIAVSDGVDAWSALQQGDFDLIVSDVDMPRMDGFALIEMIRGSSRFRELPVVLVTARETDEEKARGLAVGADAYLVKSGFDQTLLLETIGQLL